MVEMLKVVIRRIVPSSTRVYFKSRLRQAVPSFFQEHSESKTKKGYQSIHTSDGVLIEGSDRSYLHHIIFDADESGKDFLDIGSSQGYFCIEALKRGARTAVGIEPLHENVETARAISSQLGLPAEYVETDFENWKSESKFDTVLCLNVLHHMYDPIHVLRKMVEMTRDKIVIEFATPRWRDVIHGRISLLSFLLSREPILIMPRPKHPKDSVRVAEYTFMFTPSAFRTFFNVHYSAFGPVTIIRSPFKNRMIAVARKRKIDTLTVVAGPTSVGKSTFIKKLTSSSTFRKKLGIPEKIDTVASYRLYQQPLSRSLGHVVLHYDILRPFGRAIRTHERDPVLSLLSSANTVNVITLKATPERLVEQITSGEPETSVRHQTIKKLYSDPEFLAWWYGKWESFIKKIPHAHMMIVENEGEFHVRR